MLRYIKFAHLPVTDQDRALGFYTQTLGLTVVTDSPYDATHRWIELAIPGAETRALFMPRADESEGSQPVLNIVVDDVSATAAALKGKGVAFVEEPREAPWAKGEWYATFRDSENNMILIGNG